MSTSLVLDESLQIGLPCEVFFSAKNTAFSDTTLPYTTELLRGVASIAPKREPKEFEGGVPVATLKSLTYREGGTFKFETGSLTMNMLERAMGGGTLTTVAANPSATFTSHQVQLTGTAGVRLPYNGATVTTVTTNDATPVECSLTTDYTVTDGQIARVSTSSNIASGDIVLVSGTYSAPAKKTWSFGGQTNRYYYAAKVLFYKDNAKYQWVDLYKLYPKGEISVEYKGDDWNTFTIEFTMSKDSSRTAGDQICKFHDETTEA